MTNVTLLGDEKTFDLKMKDGTTKKALAFWGNESPFSNFYPSEIKLFFDLIEYKLNYSEQLFMIMKAVEFNDRNAVIDIINSTNPMQAKSLGRSVKSYDDSKWNKVRYSVMVGTLKEKFSQNDSLKQRLIATGDMILIEASPYDKIWGVGLKSHDGAIRDESKWRGQNLLGKALMEVRSRLREELV